MRAKRATCPRCGKLMDQCTCGYAAFEAEPEPNGDDPEDDNDDDEEDF